MFIANDLDWSGATRFEQAGDRVVVTTKGIIHDMRCDGTLKNGCHDVMGGRDFTTPIHVIASFVDGVHTLHSQGMGDGVVVTRRLTGNQMIWSYSGFFVARLERIPRRQSRRAFSYRPGAPRQDDGLRFVREREGVVDESSRVASRG